MSRPATALAKRFSSGPARHASVAGAEPNVEPAPIRMDSSGMGLYPLKLVDSSWVHVGDPIHAIGYPYGIDETLRAGIVAAPGRSIQASDGAKMEGAIQADAPAEEPRHLTASPMAVSAADSPRRSAAADSLDGSQGD